MLLSRLPAATRRYVRILLHHTRKISTADRIRTPAHATPHTLRNIETATRRGKTIFKRKKNTRRTTRHNRLTWTDAVRALRRRRSCRCVVTAVLSAPRTGRGERARRSRRRGDLDRAANGAAAPSVVGGGGGGGGLPASLRLKNVCIIIYINNNIIILTRRDETKSLSVGFSSHYYYYYRYPLAYFIRRTADTQRISTCLVRVQCIKQSETILKTRPRPKQFFILPHK